MKLMNKFGIRFVNEILTYNASCSIQLVETINFIYDIDVQRASTRDGLIRLVTRSCDGRLLLPCTDFSP